jgi:hypothetical protein
MAVNGINQENARNYLVNGIPSGEGEEKDYVELLERPKNRNAQPRRQKSTRLDKDDGADLVSGRKAQGERHG